MTNFEAETLTISGSTFNDVRGDYITNIMNSALDVLRDASSFSATYNSSARHPAPKCLEGTRQKVLEKIQAWISNEKLDSTRIFWLNGVSGAGKTTIAQTVAELCASQKILGASFFFSQGIADRGRNALFPSIAYQLIRAIPSLKVPIEAAVQRDPSIPFGRPNDQFHKLIIDPLLSLETPSYPPFVVVIDSIHESENEAWVEEAITLIMNALKDGRLPIRFFVTSEPEPYIRSQFRNPSLRPLTHILSLHNYDATSDIRIFLRHRFSQINVKHQHTMRDVPVPWPSDHVLEQLVEKSSGLFLYASTVGDSVDDRTRRPEEQLDVVLGIKKGRSIAVHADMDRLYTKMLSTLPPHAYDNSTQSVIGTIVLLFDFLPLEAIDELLDLKVGDASIALNGMHGFFDVPDDDEDGDGKRKSTKPVRLMHSIFREFLSDRGRAKGFAIDPIRFHGDITYFCLKVMTSQLGKNMCHLEDYSKPNHEYHDLPQSCNLYIRMALRYACRYWASHLSHTTYRASIINNLRDFAASCLKPWIETLSLLGDLHIAVACLRYVQEWLKKAPYPPTDLLKVFAETEQLVDTKFEPIYKTALKVYQYSLFETITIAEPELPNLQIEEPLKPSQVKPITAMALKEQKQVQEPSLQLQQSMEVEELTQETIVAKLKIAHVIDDLYRVTGFGNSLIGTWRGVEGAGAAGDGAKDLASGKDLPASEINAQRLEELRSAGLTPKAQAGEHNLPGTFTQFSTIQASKGSTFFIALLLLLSLELYVR